MPHSNSNVGVRKVTKPRPGFPLFCHANGHRSKKVRGKLHDFGKAANDVKGEAALQFWVDQRDDLLAELAPRSEQQGIEIRDLCNHFLTAKQHQVDSGELALRTSEDYHKACELIVQQFGARRLVDDLRPDDFQNMRPMLASRYGPYWLGSTVQAETSVHPTS